ncbi:MAG TPA: ABC transporter ATP-binding protein [Anaerolineae bacterium]|nr:ABC transporter ATP-binding protein [Anaerolineae bacterium]
MVILETQELLKTFGGLTAVNHVSLHVDEGEIFGLIGPNGAGKTTFINCITGTYTPSGGHVHFLGADTTGQRADVMCHKGMARTFQICQPFPQLTALENVLAGVIFGSTHEHSLHPEEVAEEILDFVEFSMPKDIRAEQLNTVQLKRIDLARALACRPKLLLLDELAAGLTTGELGDLMDIILKIRDGGVTILMVEHIMRVIMGLCDRIAVIQYGTKIAEGPTQEVANDPKVLEAYLGEGHTVD